MLGALNAARSSRERVRSKYISARVISPRQSPPWRGGWKNAMRVPLKGIASATKILASGEKVTYYYAWRGGPQLRGQPGSPEFVQAYEKAHRERHTPDPSLFKSIIAGYLASPEFGDVRDRTKADYMKQLAKIERAFGDLPLAALGDRSCRRCFSTGVTAWHRVLAKQTTLGLY